MTVRIKGGEFVDSKDRILNLRGINVSGSSKLPTSSSPQSPSSLDPSAPISFVGRPFPLSEADEHFTRLRACGFTLLRFIVTWEAIEHAGPGQYDIEYLRYIRSIIEKAKEYEMYIYIDPHQDVWSRWTGGDGAPLWTLEAAGFDVRYFAECEAALTKETYGRGHSTAERSRPANDGKEFPKMIWPTNYFKLACATMFTLFWAGGRYAPDCEVDGVNIQEYLQGHYVDAMRELVRHLDGLDNVVGVGTMNEPSAGYVNVTDLEKGFGAMGANGDLRYGLSPTPFQGMALGEGHARDVGDWSNGFLQHVLSRPDRTVNVDPKGKRAWKEGRGCVWKEAGVWDVDPTTKRPRLLKPDHFAGADFGSEFYVPFAARYARALREVWTGEAPLMVFVELPPLEFASTPFPKIEPSVLPDAVNATHWYDGVTLFTKSWRSHVSVDTMTRRPLLGYSAIFKSHSGHLAAIKKLGTEKMGGAPTLIGECGIPYDMNGGKSYRAARGERGVVDKLLGATPLGSSSSDPFSQQKAAMDHTISCLESNLLSYTLWCYAPDNSNEDGDVWNGEDLSVYSRDQRGSSGDGVYDGLRAAEAFVRPYAMRVAGRPLENRFSTKDRLYRLRFASAESDAPTEIFVPKLWCRAEADMDVRVSDGRTGTEERGHWFVVRYWPSGQRMTGEHSVTIKFVRR